MSRRLNYLASSPELTRKVFDLSEALKKARWNRLNIGFRNPPGSADELLGLGKSGLK